MGLMRNGAMLSTLITIHNLLRLKNATTLMIMMKMCKLRVIQFNLVRRKSQQLLVDSFKLPSACACFVREDFILEFRSNMESETDKSIVEATQPTLPPQVEQEEGEKFQFAG